MTRPCGDHATIRGPTPRRPSDGRIPRHRPAERPAEGPPDEDGQSRRKCRPRSTCTTLPWSGGRLRIGPTELSETPSTLPGDQCFEAESDKHRFLRPPSQFGDLMNQLVVRFASSASFPPCVHQRYINAARVCRGWLQQTWRLKAGGRSTRSCRRARARGPGSSRGRGRGPGRTPGHRSRVGLQSRRARPSSRSAPVRLPRSAWVMATHSWASPCHSSRSRPEPPSSGPRTPRGPRTAGPRPAARGQTRSCRAVAAAPPTPARRPHCRTAAADRADPADAPAGLGRPRPGHGRHWGARLVLMLGAPVQELLQLWVVGHEPVGLLTAVAAVEADRDPPASRPSTRHRPPASSQRRSMATIRVAFHFACIPRARAPADVSAVVEQLIRSTPLQGGPMRNRLPAVSLAVLLVRTACGVVGGSGAGRDRDRSGQRLHRDRPGRSR